MSGLISYLKYAPAASFFFIVIIVTYLAQMVRPELMEKMGFNPYRVKRNKEYSRFITSMLIHANLMHLLFNMISYYFFAFPLEYKFLGTFNFVVIFIVSQVVAQIYDYIKWKDNPSFWSVGASGAISGLIFSYVALYPTSTIYLFFIPMPSWLFAILFVLYSAYAGRDYSGGINHYAHLFGALAGFFLTLLLVPSSLERIINLLL